MPNTDRRNRHRPKPNPLRQAGVDVVDWKDTPLLRKIFS